VTTPTFEFVWLLPSLVSASAAPVELVQSGRGAGGDGTAPAPQDVERLVNLFVIVAALLGAFLLAVILFTFVRRRRATPPRMPGRANGEELADAWSEAGRRAEPLPGSSSRQTPEDGDEDPSDDSHGSDRPHGGRGRRG